MVVVVSHRPAVDVRPDRIGEKGVMPFEQPRQSQFQVAVRAVAHG
jgi:hypothetical protein